MIDHIERRALSLLLVLVMVFFMVPVQAFALGSRTLTGSIGNIGWNASIPTSNDSATDFGGVTVDGTTMTITAQAESVWNEPGCGETEGKYTYNVTSTTVTFTNSGNAEAIISFDYNPSNKVEINGTEYTAAGSFTSGNLAARGTVTVKFYSPESGNGANGHSATLTLSNIKWTENAVRSMTVKPGTNGTVSVAGTAITANKTQDVAYATGLAVSASPASGYKFLAWVDENNTVLATTASATIKPERDNMVVSALFVPTSENGHWLGNKQIFTEFQDALDAAVAGDKQVKLLDNATLTRNYTIPAGVSVLIPFDQALTAYGNNPEVVQRPSSGPPTPKVYCTLTMAADVTLTVHGSLEVGAKHVAAHGGQIDGGRPWEYYGYISMGSNSHIDLMSGANLYAWGYITGSGKVTANSGATVYEKFQIGDYRGGGITSIIVPAGVFPFNQYYVQNVEVKETILPGAKLVCHAGLYLSELTSAPINFIGGTESMFSIASGTIVKRYDNATDRLIIDMNGNGAMNPISLMDYNTANFVLPVNHNITVNINSGVTQVNQDLMLQPGAEVNVGREGYLVLASGKKVYLMDKDDWGNYCFGKPMQQISYVPLKGAAPNIRTAANMTDARVNLDGTAVIMGQLYASTAGALIESVGKTGVVILMNSAPSSTTNVKQSTITSASQVLSATTKISVGAARLTNGDGTTVNTKGAAQYTTFVYDTILDKWVTTAINIAPVLTYNPNDGSETSTVTVNFQNTALSYSPLSVELKSLEREGYAFTGWNTASDGTGKAFAAGDYITISKDATLYAQWRDAEYVVTYDANAPEGVEVTGGMSEKKLVADEKGNSEFEVPDCGFAVAGWEFDGWNTKPDGSGDAYTVGEVYTVTGDLTLYAQWSAPRYVIEFDDNAPAGTTATGTMANQEAAKGEKLNLNQFVVEGYEFTGWNTQPDGNGTAYADGATVPAEATILYAQWAKKTYTITWIVDGKETTTTVAHGDVPVFNGSTDKAQVGCTTYTFTSWNTTPVAATGPATYTAQYAEGESHDWSVTYTWSADGKTCTATHVCGRDEAHNETETVTATGKVTTPSTCTVKGTTTYTANFDAEWAVDGQTTTRQDVALAEHTPGEAVEEDRKDATCGTDGSYNSVVYCAKCGKKLSTTPTTIPATGAHVDGDDPGHDCDNCDATNVDDGHHGGTATCTDKAVCDECGEYYGSVDEDNHDWFKTTYTNITATHHTVSYICKHDATHIKNDAPVEHTYVNGVCVCTATKSYTIKWDTDGDGHVDMTTTAVHGTVPTAPSADKNDTAEFDYTFSHWVDEDGNEYTTIPAATGDVTYTAVFTSAKQVYTITWIVEGESSTTTVAYGETPVYNGTPSKAPTAEYSYTFVGWTPAVTAVTGNVEYTAKFEAVPNTYKVIYMVNGEKVHEDSFDYSAAVTAWAGYTAPEGYTFDGWDNVPATMPARDVTVTGTITIKSYTITWLDDAGNLIDTTTVKHGETPTHADANKAETAQYTYTFAGWTPEIVAATGEATYTATFTPVLRSYDITFVVDGVETKVSTKFGETPVYPNGTPTKAADAYYSYEFAGWDAVLAPVSGEATYTATWTKTPVEYTITFVIDGVEGTFYQVKGGYGTDVTYNVPSTDKTGYTFNGWDKELPATFPAENVTITGSYTVNQYTITFKGDFNTEKDDAFVDYKITKNYGEAITAEDIAALNATLPTITGWELLGWYYAEEFEYEEADEPVWEHTDEYQIPATMGAENVTVYAMWDAIVYQLTVKSSIDNKDMIYGYMQYEESYETLEEFNSVNRFCYDDSCVEEGCLCLLPEGYTFAGYKYEDGTEMTFPIECWPAEEVTIIAQFEPIDYTITFMSEGVEVGKITAPYGSDITAQVAAITATKEGYKFNCWMNEAGKCVTFTTMPLNGMTVTADFTVNKYLVNFFASEDDTTAYDSIKVEYGADLNVEELLAQVTGTPEKDGHTWTGWNTANVPATMPAEAVNIYGTWNVNKYTITFFGYVDGEEKWAVYQYKYDYNSSVNLDWKTMSKMGYDTVKLTDRDNVEATIPTTMPAENLVYRLWLERKPYTITFDTDGGSAIENLTVIYESAIEWPADPTKAGHTFQGWDMNGDGQVDTLPATMPFNNLNLKAVWAKDTVYIKWIIDGKEITQDYKYGDAITAPEATKAADAKWTYKFTGWDAEIPATATTNATFTAQFEQDEAVKYTVKFVNGENTVYETQIAWNGQVTLDGFTAPTMEGNTLTWTVDGAEAEFPYTMTTAEVTFVASWTPNTYTITADGVEYPFTYGTAVSIADPTKEGHTFAGWLKDGVVYELPETMPAENIVITSAWTVNTYTLTVDVQATNDVVKLTVPYGANLLEVLAKAAEDGEIPAIGYSYRVSDEYINGERVVSGYTYWVDNAIGWGEVGETLNMPASDFDIVQDCTGFGWYFYYDNDDAYIGADFYDKENEWLDGWQYIEEDYDDVAGGAWYYFAYAELDSGDGCWIANFRAEDITLITKDGVEGYYAFDHESGKWLNTYTGIYTASNGDLYYVENGIAVKNKGMVQVDDPAVENGHLYYYFGCGDSNCTAVGCAGEYKAQRGISHWTEITNGYLVLWGYEFNQDGTIVHDEDTSKNGVHLDDGVKYYYIDGVKVHYGLFIGEDGEYYYARSNGSLVVGRDYWISGSNLNGVERDGEPVKEGTYTFDEEGRIVWPTSAKNGVYAEDGSLYFYKDGARSYEGLIKYSGSLTAEDGTVTENVYVEDLIYVRTSGELAVNRSYWPTKNNGVMPSATYNFDEYGRKIRTNGFVEEDGGIYYYVNGNRYHAGLIKVDDAFYYVKSSGQVVTGCRYWISHTNGYDVEEGSYEFAADGKMIIPEPETVKNGIVEENGKLYYYVDGKLNYAGLIVYSGSLTTEDGTVIDNAYVDAWIYVRGTGELVVGRSYWVTKHNDLLEKSATYQFDENGVMQNAPM